MRRRGGALRKRYGWAAKLCPAGSVTQSILFPRKAFSVESAKSWAQRHGHHSAKVDVTDNFIRLRQESPGGFRRMRNIPFGESGIRAVVAWQKC